MPLSAEGREKVEWLAREIFNRFGKEVEGLRLYILECGCIYYRIMDLGGVLGRSVVVYRDAARGECRVCLEAAGEWEERVLEDVGVYGVRVEVG